MLQNAYLLAKIGADTAENEQHFAEILPKSSNYHACGGDAHVCDMYGRAAREGRAEGPAHDDHGVERPLQRLDHVPPRQAPNESPAVGEL